MQRVDTPDLSSEVGPETIRVFVLRSEQATGGGRAVIVYDSHREIGRLGKGAHLAWDHPASRRLLRVVFDRPALDGGVLETLVDHNAEGGQTVYYEVALRGPLESAAGTPVVTRLDGVQGAELVERSAQAAFERGR
ncbi:MAG: hypothetical protein AAF682_20280 [Planctomycetota bacterium]